MLNLRRYRSTDAEPLLNLFRDTVRRVNSRDYSPQQVRAWATDDIDLKAWAERFDGRFVVVAELADRLVGFAELENDGHIDRMFVSADHQSEGIGTQLMSHIIAESERRGFDRINVEASITAHPFFERHGFVTIAKQSVRLRDTELTNYRMERIVDLSGS